MDTGFKTNFGVINDLKEIILGICDLPSPHVYYCTLEKETLIHGLNPQKEDKDLCSLLKEKQIDRIQLFCPPQDYSHLKYQTIIGLQLNYSADDECIFIFDKSFKSLNRSQKNALEGLMQKSDHLVNDVSPAEVIKNYLDGIRCLNEIISNQRKSYRNRIDEVLAFCVDFLQLEIGIISEVQDDTYKILHYYPKDAPLQEGQTFPLASTYCDIVVQSKRPIAISKMAKSEHSNHPCYEAFNLESYIGASYHLPIKNGTINFSSSAARAKKFTDYDIQFIELVAKWGSSIISQKEVLRKLDLEQTILKSFVETAPAAIAMFDTEMRYMAVSHKWISDYNIERNVIGLSHYDIFPGMEKKWKEIHTKVLDGTASKNEELKLRRKDGSKQYIKWEASLWSNIQNEIGGFTIFTENITGQVESRKELAVANESIDKNLKASEILVNMANTDLREPIGIINKLTQVIIKENEDKVEEKTMQMLSAIVECCDRIDLVVKKIIDYRIDFSNNGNTPNVDIETADHLIKPIQDQTTLLKALAITDKAPKTLYVRENALLVGINTDDILYLEAFGDYVKIYTKKKTFVIHTTMAKIESRLNDDFIKIHRSFIIRLDKIENISQKNLQINNKIVPMSQSMRPKLMSKINSV